MYRDVIAAERGVNVEVSALVTPPVRESGRTTGPIHTREAAHEMCATNWRTRGDGASAGAQIRNGANEVSAPPCEAEVNQQQDWRLIFAGGNFTQSVTAWMSSWAQTLAVAG